MSSISYNPPDLPPPWALDDPMRFHIGQELPPVPQPPFLQPSLSPSMAQPYRQPFISSMPLPSQDGLNRNQTQTMAHREHTYTPFSASNADFDPPRGSDQNTVYANQPVPRPIHYQQPTPLSSTIEPSPFTLNPASLLGGTFKHPLGQIGLQQASNFVHSVNDGYVNHWINTLRYYFSVDNRYVINKLRIILCPFTNRVWSRRIVPAADHQEMYLPPSMDLNAPDLYIPVMAFITYILMVALYMSLSVSQFKPEVLGVTASSGIITLIAQVAIIKLIFYLLSYPPTTLLDFLSYFGYHYVNLSILITMAWIHTAVFIPFYLYLISTWSIFIAKTIRLLIPHNHMSPVTRNARTYVIISVILVQGILLFSQSYFVIPRTYKS